MREKDSSVPSCHLRFLAVGLRALLAASAGCWLGVMPISAQLWTGTGTPDNNWNNTGNWNPATVPNVNTDVAEFATGPTSRDITLESGNFTVNRLIFSASTDYTLNTGTITFGGTNFAGTSGNGQISKTGAGAVTLGSGLTVAVGSGGNYRNINFNSGGAGTMNLNNIFSGSGGTGITINNHSGGAAIVNWNASSSGFSTGAALNMATGTTPNQTTTLRLNGNSMFPQLTVGGSQGRIEAIGQDRSYDASFSMGGSAQVLFQGDYSISFNGNTTPTIMHGANSNTVITNNIVAGKSLTFANREFNANASGGRSVTVAGTGLTVFQGGIQHGGTDRRLNLTKSGSGTLMVLANSYSSAGDASSTINITAGTFAGNAVIGYDPTSSPNTLTTTVTGANTRLAPRTLTDTGTLTFRNGLTATAANTDFEFSLNGTAAISQLAISGGSFNLSSARTYTFDLLNLDGSTLQAGVIYTLIDPTGSTWDGTATKSNFVLGILGSGLVLDTTYATTGWDFNSGALTVRFDAIPEPSTYALLGLGIGALIWLRRRQKA